MIVTSTSTPRIGWLIAFGLAALGAPAQADWLLTRDGARVETRGPWTVKGKLVVFTLANGTLSSLRAEAVDLEASARATAEAQARTAAPAPEPAPVAKPRPVLVLTDADVEHVDEEGEPAAGEGAGTAEAATGEGSPAEAEGAARAGALTVPSWDQVHDADRNLLEIYGVVRNGGRDVMANVTVEAAVYDENGLLLTTGSAALTEPALQPGATANFRLAFPGLTAIAAARFEVRGTPIATRIPPPSEAPPPPTGETPVDAPGAP
jgi:hypothetical protein